MDNTNNQRDYGEVIKSMMSRVKQLQSKHDNMNPDFVQKMNYMNEKIMFYQNLTEANTYHNMSQFVTIPEHFLQGVFKTKINGCEFYLDKMENALKD